MSPSELARRLLVALLLAGGCTSDVTLGAHEADAGPDAGGCTAGDPNCTGGGDGTPGCTAGDPNCTGGGDGTPGCDPGDPNCIAGTVN